MDIDWNEWGPPLVVLVGGTLAGAYFALQTRASSQERARVNTAGVRTDLEQRKTAIVQALKDLDTERDKMDPADYERERQALVARGADAMRRLDGGVSASPAVTVDPASAGALPAAALRLSLSVLAALEQEQKRLGDAAYREALAALAGVAPAANATGARSSASAAGPDIVAPAWRGAGWALGIVALIGGLYWAAQQNQAPRDGMAPMTGTIPSGGAMANAAPQRPAADPADEAEKTAMLARLTKDPNDLEALNKLTILALSAEDAQTAMNYNSTALKVAPKDPDALTQRAVISAMIGMKDHGIDVLNQVLADHPDHAMANVYKGLLLLDVGRPAEAIPVLQHAIDVKAANPEFLQQKIDEAKDKVAHPEKNVVAPPDQAPSADGGPAQDGGAAPGGETLVSGTLELSPADQDKVAQAQFVFVSIKDPNGPPMPLAALKLPVGPFPMAFSITSANVIPMGGARPIPDVVTLSARLDFDGNAMTHADGEPNAVSQVAKGSTGLDVMLQ